MYTDKRDLGSRMREEERNAECLIPRDDYRSTVPGGRLRVTMANVMDAAAASTLPIPGMPE